MYMQVGYWRMDLVEFRIHLTTSYKNHVNFVLG